MSKAKDRWFLNIYFHKLKDQNGSVSYLVLLLCHMKTKVVIVTVNCLHIILKHSVFIRMTIYCRDC